MKTFHIRIGEKGLLKLNFVGRTKDVQKHVTIYLQDFLRDASYTT